MTTQLLLLGLGTVAPELRHFEFRVTAMTILSTWAVANLVVGGAGAALARAHWWRIFFGANAAWNLVNLAIASFGLWAAASHEPGTYVGGALVREMVFFRDLLVLNVGLDVGYVMAGVVAWLWGRDRPCPWRSAIGVALVVQGIFLFVFDLMASSRVTAQLQPLWSEIGG